MSFDTIETDRLTIRRPEIGDVEAFHRRRNDPDTARYQSWTLPFPLDEARKTIAGAAAMDGPAEDEWWMVTIVERRSQTIIGDVAIHLSWQGRVAEIGYTLRPDRWGHGYATEAADAVVDTLIERGVRRVTASTAPENLASVRVLEHLGFDYEGRTVESFFVDDGPDAETSDELLFGLTVGARARWLARPTGRPRSVRLIEITDANQRAVAELATSYSQRNLVAPVAASYGDALFPELIDGVPVRPWLRAIEIDEDRDGDTETTGPGRPTLAGFVMMAVPSDTEEEPYLWRLLIDHWHQRRGIASLALDQIEAELRNEDHAGIVVHWVPGPGSSEPFYLARGYEPTGRIEDGETEGRKRLT